MSLIALEPNNEPGSGLYRNSVTGKVGLYVRGVKIIESDSVTLETPLPLSVPDVVGSIEKWPYRIPAASGIDTDGLKGGLAGCDQVLDVTKTEAPATYCKVWDDSGAAFANLETASAGAFTQWALFPGTTQDTDIVYFGSALKFCQLYFDMSATVQTYTGDATVWEYWDGASWTELVVHDYTDATAQDGKRSFGRDGAVNFLPPSDWAATSVGSVTAFWVRCKAGTVANISQIGITNSKRHYICSPTDGFVVGHDCVIDEAVIRDEASTAHTTTDIKFILFNFTTGAHTSELTFPQDKRNDRFTGLALSCAAGDVVGLVVTQEDGTAEMGPLTVELGVTLA